MKLAVTGQDGFIGYHLYHNLKFSGSYKILDFKKSYFDDPIKLDNLISRIDVIIHLAGINRSKNKNDIFTKNMLLTEKLIDSFERTRYKGKLIFASSIKYNENNAYGKSKKKSSEMFFDSSNNLGFTFINLIIPNVYGPFCKPNYNSFIATFCHNSVNNIKNQIKEDNTVPLIYIDNLVSLINKKIDLQKSEDILVKEDININVSRVKNIIEDFKEIYFINGNIPDLSNNFKINLFNTFHSYMDYNIHFPRKYNLANDERGSFTEIIRTLSKGQTSFSTTIANHVRGNHFHSRKIERFSVLDGEALINIRKVGTNKVFSFKLSGKVPCYIDMKVWHTHNIENIGDSKLITVFWINEFYDKDDPDTFFEKV